MEKSLHSEDDTVGLAAEWTIAEREGALQSAVMWKQRLDCPSKWSTDSHCDDSIQLKPKVKHGN